MSRASPEEKTFNCLATGIFQDEEVFAVQEKGRRREQTACGAQRAEPQRVKTRHLLMEQ